MVLESKQADWQSPCRLLCREFFGTCVVADSSRAVVLTQDRSVNVLLQVFHEFVKSRLGNVVGGRSELALDVCEDYRVTESSCAASAKARVGLAETVITLDQISDVVPLPQIPSNRTDGVFSRSTGPAATKLINGRRTGVHVAIDGTVGNRGNVRAVCNRAFLRTS